MADARRIARGVAFGGLGLFGAAVLGTVGLYGFAQTQPGRDFIAARIGEALSDKSLTVRLAGLQGSLTSSFSIDRITFADGGGVFATAHDNRLVWRPLALLDGTIEIDSLSVAKLAVDRPPRADALSPSDTTRRSGLGYAIRARKLEVGEAALAQPVLGEAQRLSATAAMSLERDLSNAALDMTLRRTDGGKDKAEIKLDYAARPARFGARVRVEEPSGGVLARLAGLPQGDRLFADLSGTGPPDAWKGKLAFESGSDVAVNADVSLALRDTAVDISLAGSARVASRLPSEWRPLLAPAVRFRSDAAFEPGKELSVRRFTAESDLLTLAGTGRYRTADDQVSATVTGRIHENSTLSALLPGVAVSRAGFDAKLAGTFDAPRLNLRFQTGRIAAGPVHLASTEGSVALEPGPSGSLALKGSAKGDGFQPGNVIPAGLTGPTLDVDLAGRLEPDGALSDVTVTTITGPTRATLWGQLDRGSRGRGRYRVRLDRLAPLARAAELTASGQFETEGLFEADLATGKINLSARGFLSDLSVETPEITALLGKRIPVSGTLDWRDGAPLQFTGMKLNPALGPVDADGSFDAATGILAAKLNLAVDDLDKLSKLAQARLAGSATLSATLDGRFGALAAQGEARLAGLRINDAAFGTMGIGYDAKQEAATVKSKLRLGGDFRGKKLDGTLTGVFSAARVDLSAIRISVGNNRLTGRLGLDATRRRLSGTIKADLSELSDLPGAAERGLSGSGEITAAADADGADEIVLTGTARNIRIADEDAAGATIDTAEMRFRVREPFGRVSAAGEASFDNVRLAGLQDGKVKFDIEGNASAIDWTVTASGEAAHPVSVSSNGTLSLAAARSRLSVAKLTGKYADQPIDLRAPFSVTWQAKDWQVEPIDFSLASGHFRFAGSMAGGVLDAKGAFDDLPLRLAALIDPAIQMDGNVAGNIQASGAPKEAVLTMTVTAHHIRPPDVATKEFPGFDLTMDVRQNDKQASATVNLTGPDRASAALSVKSKPVIGLSPISVTLDPGLPIEGEVTANGELGLIDRLVGLGEDRIAGRVSAKATLGGTFGKPVVRGETRLSGGAYEGAATGTVLRTIEGHVIFSGDSARLVSLTANDGGKGRLSGKGEMDFAEPETPSPGVTVTLNHFTALRHPMVEAEVSGVMTLAGSLKAPYLSGRLQVEKAEINIPEKLPEQVVQLDVTEINREAANVPAPPAEHEVSLAETIPVSLDVAVTIPRRTFVRGRGLDTEWKGNLTITGKTDAPVVNGKLEAVRGTFAFAGKTFVIKSGNVAFPNGATEPEISAVAEATLTDLVARVEISGSISKPTITITSDPAMPQEDVLAHILFGRTAGQLSAIQAAQLAQTAATLSGKGGIGIMDKVRQALGVDVLNVETEEGESKGASLKAGKYITDDIFLSVTQGTQPGSQKVGVEVQVLPNITVESDISGTADSNIGINWKWDY